MMWLLCDNVAAAAVAVLLALPDGEVNADGSCVCWCSLHGCCTTAGAPLTCNKWQDTSRKIRVRTTADAALECNKRLDTAVRARATSLAGNKRQDTTARNSWCTSDRQQEAPKNKKRAQNSPTKTEHGAQNSRRRWRPKFRKANFGRHFLPLCVRAKTGVSEISARTSGRCFRELIRFLLRFFVTRISHIFLWSRFWCVFWARSSDARVFAQARSFGRAWRDPPAADLPGKSAPPPRTLRALGGRRSCPCRCCERILWARSTSELAPLARSTSELVVQCTAQPGGIP